MNFTFLKILKKAKKQPFYIFLVCFLFLGCANKGYSKVPSFSTPASDGVQATPSLSNASLFPVVQVNSSLNTGVASFFEEVIHEAWSVQNTFFYANTIILKQ